MASGQYYHCLGKPASTQLQVVFIALCKDFRLASAQYRTTNLTENCTHDTHACSHVHTCTHATRQSQDFGKPGSKRYNRSSPSRINGPATSEPTACCGLCLISGLICPVLAIVKNV
ncbi:hypothetical protein LSTR_LSTR017486 [Laodelphax striatellus]|uniref:Uncharacterized protein n=1 Tax=Laodelphax striatellus TaxID=195883 RepID=A0A482XIF5_LAOST|nr:hypothetical protein LSTR_LSTR000770 [Laodelphax striatellus]RZF45437.1 hypothetical protein LSTR_LSTR017486 [Laodelphax striatellus]